MHLVYLSTSPFLDLSISLSLSLTIYIYVYYIYSLLLLYMTQSVGAVEYTDCISTEG